MEVGLPPFLLLVFTLMPSKIKIITILTIKTKISGMMDN